MHKTHTIASPAGWASAAPGWTARRPADLPDWLDAVAERIETRCPARLTDVQAEREPTREPIPTCGAGPDGLVRHRTRLDLSHLSAIATVDLSLPPLPPGWRARAQADRFWLTRATQPDTPVEALDELLGEVLQGPAGAAMMEQLLRDDNEPGPDEPGWEPMSKSVEMLRCELWIADAGLSGSAQLNLEVLP